MLKIAKTIATVAIGVIAATIFELATSNEVKEVQLEEKVSKLNEQVTAKKTEFSDLNKRYAEVHKQFIKEKDYLNPELMDQLKYEVSSLKKAKKAAEQESEELTAIVEDYKEKYASLKKDLKLYAALASSKVYGTSNPAFLSTNLKITNTMMVQNSKGSYIKINLDDIESMDKSFRRITFDDGNWEYLSKESFEELLKAWKNV